MWPLALRRVTSWRASRLSVRVVRWANRAAIGGLFGSAAQAACQAVGRPAGQSSAAADTKDYMTGDEVLPGSLRAEAERCLRALAGPDARLREDQWTAVRALVEDRRRALVVQRTGWGKSA